jgi:hypothetical protein
VAIITQIDCDELAEMNEQELCELLADLGDSEDTTLLEKQDILDHIIDQYAPRCFAQLHSEGRDYDYGNMHPDETVDEFQDHEDYEPRDR